MEKVDLNALEAALAKATPGKWVRRSSGISACAIDSIAENGNSKYLGEFYGPDLVENAIFIVSAHNALPALVAELRELRQEADRARWCEQMKANVSWSDISRRWRVIWVTGGLFNLATDPDRSAAIDAARGVK
jgi:hypothetical protein